jgi:hypothetical protein
MKHQAIDFRVISVALLATVLAACAAPPPRRVVVRDEVAPPPAPPPARIIVYPAHGQTADQLERDRYECNTWAVKETGFDPSLPGVPQSGRVVVQPAVAPGSGTAVGAIAGAILGAAVAGPRNAGGGAIVGAIAGGAVGTASEANANAEAAYEQSRVDQQADRADRAAAVGAASYRRAMGACLEARGYTTA